MRYQLLIRALLVSVAATVAFGALAAAIDTRADLPAQLFGTAAIVSVCLGVLVTLGAAWRREPIPIAAAISVLATFVGAAAFLILIWFEDQMRSRTEDTFACTGASGLFIGGCLAHSAIFRCLVTRSFVLRVARVATMVVCWLFVVLFVLLIWSDDFANAMFTGTGFIGGMVMIAMALSALTGTIVVPIAVVSLANRDDPTLESFEQHVPIEVGCPKCGHQQTILAGATRCTGCRAVMKIEIEEPRCACGYLLYRLEGDSCPECGAMVTAGVSWTEAPA